jgi:hypothetical protein
MPCVMPVSRLGLAYGGLDKGMGIMDGWMDCTYVAVS